MVKEWWKIRKEKEAKLKEKSTKLGIAERAERAELRHLVEKLSKEKIGRTTKLATIEERLPKVLEEAADRIQSYKATYPDLLFKKINLETLIESQGVRGAAEKLIELEQKVFELHPELKEELAEKERWKLKKLITMGMKKEEIKRKLKEEFPGANEHWLTEKAREVREEIEDKLEGEKPAHKIRVAKGTVPEEVLEDVKEAEARRRELEEFEEYEFPPGFEEGIGEEYEPEEVKGPMGRIKERLKEKEIPFIGTIDEIKAKLREDYPGIDENLVTKKAIELKREAEEVGWKADQKIIGRGPWVRKAEEEREAKKVAAAVGGGGGGGEGIGMSEDAIKLIIILIIIGAVVGILMSIF